MRDAGNSLLFLLCLLGGSACEADVADVAAPDAAADDAHESDAASVGNAMSAFDNQDGLPEPACAQPQPGSLFLWACAEREGSTARVDSLELQGEVEEIVEGPWSCLGGWVTSGLPGSRRFRIADGAGDVWIGWTLPMELVAVGDVLSVEYDSHLGQHSTSGQLIVERADGSLVGWLGKDNLSPPSGIHVEHDGEPCSYETQCGTVELDGLQVEVFSERAQVPYMASVEVGDYVVQGGYDTLTGSKCLEAQSRSASAVAVYARTRPNADAGER